MNRNPAEGWRRWLRIWRRSPETDVDAELRFHLDARVDDLVAGGATPATAKQRAEAEFGDVESVRVDLAEIGRRIAARQGRTEWWEGIAYDLRYAVRGLLREPGFTVMVVVTLALGLGTNAALFSVLDSLFLRQPVGVALPSQMHRVYADITFFQRDRREASDKFSFSEVRDIRGALPPNVTLTGYVTDRLRLGRDGAAPEGIVAFVTGDYFDVAGVHAVAGRALTYDESRLETFSPVAVISDRLWRAQYGGSLDALGKPIDLGSHRYTIVGVAPAGFRGLALDAADLFVPLNTIGNWKTREPDMYKSNRYGFQTQLVVRATSDAALRAFELASTRALSASALPSARLVRNVTATVSVGPLIEALGPVRGAQPDVAISTRLAGVALIILLIACANVANLMLARGSQRRREIAVRLALGVSARRLVAQLLIESVLVALVAGGVALLAALWGANALRAFLLGDIQWAAGALSARAVAFVITMSVVTGLCAGLPLAVHASRRDLTDALKSGARDGTLRRSRLRPALLAAQATLSVILLAGAGLFVRSLNNIRAVDIGYATDHVLSARVAYDEELESHDAEIYARLPELAERLRQLPGVERTALTNVAPMRGLNVTRIVVPGRDSLPKLNGSPPGFNLAVSPEYFSTVGMRIVHGRGFRADDQPGSEPVVVINESFASTMWPGEDAVGKCFVLGTKGGPCRLVVGVVSDAHLLGIVEKPVMQFFRPLESSGTEARPWEIMLKTAPGRANFVRAQALQIFRQSFGTWATPKVRSMSESLDREVGPYRLGAVLFSAAGLLALLVAAVGVYSTVAYAIGQRMHEMGVRVALGARAWDIVRLVLAEGLRVVTVGVAIGIVASLALGRLVASMLYGTTPRDPVVLASVAVVLLAVATVACLVPAVRATRVDPVNALKAE